MRNVGMRVEGWREMELQNRGFSFFFFPADRYPNSISDGRKKNVTGFVPSGTRAVSYNFVLTTSLGYTFFDYFRVSFRSCCYRSGGIA